MLTVVEVRNAKPKERPYKISDGKSLYLFVMPNGRKVWRYRYRFSGAESTITLGEYPATGLETARAARAVMRDLLKAGKNPAEERRQDKKDNEKAQETENKLATNSFEAIALEWHNNKRDGWSKGHASSILKTLKRDVFPAIGAIPIDQIYPPAVLAIIKSIEARGTLEVASKINQRMSAVFRYAVQSGKATYNPASDMRGVLKSRKVKHHSMVQPSEFPELLRNLTKSDIHITTKLALQFTILTAARSGEVRGALWDEIDMDKKIWSIPANRMKMDIPHTVPLSSSALAILSRIKILFNNKRLVFPGVRNPEKPLSENTMLFALYRIGYHSRCTIHGFRALFSTITNEAGFSPDAIERQLAHQEKNAVRAAYHRSEYMPERTKLMQWWADYLHDMEYAKTTTT